MIKKHTQIGKVLRKNRKKCYIQIGKEEYDFDIENELLEYKYLCCARMKRKEWRQCKKKSMPYSYHQWKESIKQKYVPYSIEQLEEFTRYLELGIVKNNATKESGNIFYAALASGVIAVYFGELTDLQSQEIIYVIIGSVFIILMLGFIIYAIVPPIFDDNLEGNLYKDYKKIIEQIIMEKEES